MIREAIEQLVSGRALTQEQAAQVMEEIMTGQATPAQLGAFVTALRLKGETAAEIAGMARVMRAKAVPVSAGDDVIDTCGTGGDHQGTFNISTAAALVAAACGAKVAKHGNRAVTSGCGSADVLEALGVKIDLGPEGVARCIREEGFGFMFAPAYHPAMKFAAGPRKEIGIRTVFNILGPLTNPAGAKHQVLGVADYGVAKPMVEVLRLLGSTRALVVHGEDGVDELSLGASNMIYELKDGAISAYSITPDQLGLKRTPVAQLKGGSAAVNAEIMRRLFKGERGPLRDVVSLNASAALLVAGKIKDLKEGIAVAQQAMDDGRALRKVEAVAKLSQGLK